ncbi:MAG: MerR family transcriptional regulator, partial [Gammaproteobacteria bacterium]|nr:MerR family transcriptional regulator [Gammaproteobacteria bacterium]
DGLELVIEPGRAHLTPEQLRRLAREVLAAHARITQEQDA